MNDDRKYHKVMVELMLSVFSEDILILAMSSPNIGHTVSGLNSISPYAWKQASENKIK